MTTLTATDARNNIGKLWQALRAGPVTVESAGRPIAVVVSPDEYEALQRAAGGGRRPTTRAGFAKDLLGDLDVRALLDTPVEGDFEDLT